MFSKHIRLCAFLSMAAALALLAASIPGTIIFAGVLSFLPVAWTLKMWLGTRSAIAAIAFFVVVALVFGFTLSVFAIGNSAALLAVSVPSLLIGASAVSRLLFGSAIARVTIGGLIFVIFTALAGLNPAAEAGAASLSELALTLFGLGLAVAGAVELTLAVLRPLLPTPAQLLWGVLFIFLFSTVTAASAGQPGAAALGVASWIAVLVLYMVSQYAFDEMIVFVDDANHAIGTAPKLEAHNSDTPLHRAFSVFLFNSKGEVLLQRRSLSKKTWPGVWSNSCCGHVMLHETVKKAAARRLRQELGLTGVNLTIALPDFRYRAEKNGVVENELCPVLIGFTDKPPKPNPLEVAEVRLENWKEFLRYIGDPANEVSPWAVEEVGMLASCRLFIDDFARNTGRDLDLESTPQVALEPTS